MLKQHSQWPLHTIFWGVPDDNESLVVCFCLLCYSLAHGLSTNLIATLHKPKKKLPPHPTRTASRFHCDPPFFFQGQKLVCIGCVASCCFHMAICGWRTCLPIYLIAIIASRHIDYVHLCHWTWPNPVATLSGAARAMTWVRSVTVCGKPRVCFFHPYPFLHCFVAICLTHGDKQFTLLGKFNPLLRTVPRMGFQIFPLSSVHHLLWNNLEPPKHGILLILLNPSMNLVPERRLYNSNVTASSVSYMAWASLVPVYWGQTCLFIFNWNSLIHTHITLHMAQVLACFWVLTSQSVSTCCSGKWPIVAHCSSNVK